MKPAKGVQINAVSLQNGCQKKDNEISYQQIARYGRDISHKAYNYGYKSTIFL